MTKRWKRLRSSTRVAADPTRRVEISTTPAPSGRPPTDYLVLFATALFVGTAVWFSRAIVDFFAPPIVNVAVPNFVGANENDAVDEGRSDHLQAVVVARRSDERYPKGVVMSQDPKAGEQVRELRRISLIVSSGVDYATLPDLRYRSQRDAELLLAHLRLREGKTRVVDNDDIDAGHIVAQDPSPQSVVRQGTSVNFVISKGPPTSVNVPDFVGLELNDARDVAGHARVRIGQVVWTPFGPNGAPRGVVVRQRPYASSSIDPRRFVSLQVSAGPGEYGYLVREVHAGVTIPLADPTAHVRVVAIDDTGSHDVYDAFGASGQHIDMVATTIGSSELDTFVNGELLDRTELGKEPAQTQEHPAARGTTMKILDSMLHPAPAKPTHAPVSPTPATEDFTP